MWEYVYVFVKDNQIYDFVSKMKIPILQCVMYNITYIHSNARNRIVFFVTEGIMYI